MPDTSASASHEPIPGWILSLCGISGVAMVLVLLRVLPLGMPGSIVLSYRTAFIGTLSFRALVLGSVMLTGLVVLPRGVGRVGRAGLLATLFALVVGTNLLLHRPSHYSWVTRTVYTCFPPANPFFGAARAKSARQFIAWHGAHARQGYAAGPVEQRRLTTYPPGLPIAYAWLGHTVNAIPGATDTFSRIALLGLDEALTAKDLPLLTDDRPMLAAAAAVLILVVLLTGGIAVAVCLCALRLGSGESGALRAGVLVGLVPAVHLYAATPGLILAGWSSLLLVLCLWAQKRNSVGLAVVAGLWGAVGVILSYAALPVLLFCLLLFAVSARLADKTRQVRVLSAWCGAGAAGYVLFWLAGFEALGGFLTAMANNKEFYGQVGRGWLASIPFNALEFGLFCGPVAIALLVTAAVTALREGECSVATTAETAYPVLLAGLLGLLLVSGGARGEVSRNWLLLMPLVTVGAVPVLNRLSERCWAVVGICAAVYMFVACLMIETTFNF